jgi:hypothetical protein
VRDTCCTRQINERRAGVTPATMCENPEFAGGDETRFLAYQLNELPMSDNRNDFAIIGRIMR